MNLHTKAELLRLCEQLDGAVFIVLNIEQEYTEDRIRLAEREGRHIARKIEALLTPGVG